MTHSEARSLDVVHRDRVDAAESVLRVDEHVWNAGGSALMPRGCIGGERCDKETRHPKGAEQLDAAGLTPRTAVGVTDKQVVLLVVDLGLDTAR